MKKILFLDVDGVLNCTQTFLKTNFENDGVTRVFSLLDDDIMPLLKRVVDTCGCDIVLSSTWRLGGSAKETLKEAFKRFGIPIWVSQTPHIKNNDRSVQRKEEILKWLHDNVPMLGSTRVKVAILDDDQDADLTVQEPDNTPMPHIVFRRDCIEYSVSCLFLETTFEFGMTCDHADSAIRFFNEE